MSAGDSAALVLVAVVAALIIIFGAAAIIGFGIVVGAVASAFNA
jgi:hypothetical protein